MARGAGKTSCTGPIVGKSWNVKRTGVVGAGVSGLAAAWELKRQGREVIVFEKSRGLSGRAATRRRGPHCYDHGANFFRTEDPEVHHLIHEVLPGNDLVEIPGEVWTFDAAGGITPGDPEQNAKPKYTYRQGISTLGKLLAASVGVEPVRETRITSLRQRGMEWVLIGEDHQELGSFEQILLTMPAPQVLSLLEASELDDSMLDGLRSALQPATYTRQFTFILGYGLALQRNPVVHALVNSDGGHRVGWLSFEEDKPGHVAGGESVLVVQMSPAWSARHYDERREELLEVVVAQARQLLPEVREPDWWDSQRWGFAQPRAPADPAPLRRGEEAGLFVAGDGMMGRGRVPLAIKSGLVTARRLVAMG